MYHIEENLSSKELFVTINGIFSEITAQEYKKDVLNSLNKFSGKIKVLFDQRKVSIHTPEADIILDELRSITKNRIEKSAVVTIGIVAKLHSRRTSGKMSTGFNEKYFTDLSKAKKWLNETM